MFISGVPGTPVRRGSLTKPSPPIRRSSSISGTCPVSLPIVARSHQPLSDQQPRSGSTTPTPDTTPTQDMEDAVSIHTQMTELDNVQDDLELPPPPPELLNPVVDEVRLPQQPTLERINSIGSIQNSHAQIIECLNVKFSQQPPSTAPCHRPTDFGGEAGAIGEGYSERRFSSHSSDDATPTADSPNTGSFLYQITRGVSLKKTVSNDRSAPKFT